VAVEVDDICMEVAEAPFHRFYAVLKAWDVSGVSIVETLIRVVPVVTRNLAAAPDPATLRAALRKQLNQGHHAGTLTGDEAKAITWLTKASRPISALDDPAIVCELLDALAVRLDGSPAAPEYFSRRRRVLHRALAYAVRRSGSRRTR